MWGWSVPPAYGEEFRLVSMPRSPSDLFFSCGCTFRELNARVLSTSCSPLGTFMFSVDVLVLLRRLLPMLCSECVGCFLQNLPEIPLLLMKTRKRRAGQGALDMHELSSHPAPISYQTAAFMQQNNSFL